MGYENEFLQVGYNTRTGLQGSVGLNTEAGRIGFDPNRGLYGDFGGIEYNNDNWSIPSIENAVDTVTNIGATIIDSAGDLSAFH